MAAWFGGSNRHGFHEAATSCSAPFIAASFWNWQLGARSVPRSRLVVDRLLRHRLALALPPGVEPLGQLAVGEREHAGRKQRRIDGAGLADRERPDRDAS